MAIFSNGVEHIVSKFRCVERDRATIRFWVCKRREFSYIVEVIDNGDLHIFNNNDYLSTAFIDESH